MLATLFYSPVTILHDPPDSYSNCPVYYFNFLAKLAPYMTAASARSGFFVNSLLAWLRVHGCCSYSSRHGGGGGDFRSRFVVHKLALTDNSRLSSPQQTGVVSPKLVTPKHSPWLATGCIIEPWLSRCLEKIQVMHVWYHAKCLTERNCRQAS